MVGGPLKSYGPSRNGKRGGGHCTVAHTGDSWGQGCPSCILTSHCLVHCAVYWVVHCAMYRVVFYRVVCLVHYAWCSTLCSKLYSEQARPSCILTTHCLVPCVVYWVVHNAMYRTVFYRLHYALCSKLYSEQARPSCILTTQSPPHTHFTPVFHKQHTFTTSQIGHNSCKYTYARKTHNTQKSISDTRLLANSQAAYSHILY